MRIFFLTLSSFAIAALAQRADAQIAQPHCEEAQTVFQDVAVGGRKNRAAENMTERHEEMRAKGWRFADLEIYTENQDLEGFYITYVRTVACASKAK